MRDTSDDSLLDRSDGGWVPQKAGGLGARAGPLAGLALLLTLFLASGLRGLDFGRHWDEFKQVEVVAGSIESGRLLPNWYFYPSVTYWLSCVPLVPPVVRLLVTEKKPFSRVDYPKTRERLQAELHSRTYRMRMRAIFLGCSSLGLLWLFLVRHGPGGGWRGLYAAALVGTSFEVAYHARWVAPDLIMMQFVALFLACMSRVGPAGGGRRWWMAAALAAGAATATKYTAGLLLLPLLAPLSARTGADRRGGREGTDPNRRVARFIRARFGLRLLALWAVTFVALTPGSLLEPVKFFQDLKFERLHYMQHGHYGFTVERGAQHYGLMLRYLTTELFSPWWLMAVASGGLALVGAIVFLKENWRRALVFALFPSTYLLYFGFTRVLFVRNLLVLAPFAALLAAQGAAFLSGRVKPRGPRALVVSMLAALPLSSAGWMVYAATTIPAGQVEERPQERETTQRRANAKDFLKWAQRRSDRRLLLSPEVWKAVQALGEEPPPNATRDALQAVDYWVVSTGEGPSWSTWQSNVPGAFSAEFGPRDTNFDWYTSWPSPRILVLTPQRAEALGIRLP